MHMNGLYRKATDVLIWLGDEAENSHLAFDALEIFPKDESVHWYPVVNPRLGDVLANPEYGLAVEKLFQRSWWHRVWTAQESILGREITFICGARQISGAALVAVESGFCKHLFGCCDQARTRIQTGPLHWQRYSLLVNMLSRLRVSRSYQKTTTIFHLLAIYRSRSCTDPRDKIYGLLGLTNGEESSLIVSDYASPVSTVYEQVTLKLLQHHRNLDMFSQILSRSLKRDGITVVGLPSWAPDWTLEGTKNQLLDLYNRLVDLRFYNASGGSLASVKLAAPGKISLRGIPLDSCSRFSEPNDSMHLYKLSTFKPWIDLVADKLSLLYPDPFFTSTTSTTTYEDAYWQTLCGSIVPKTTEMDFVPPSAYVRSSNDCIQRSWYDNWSAYMQTSHLFPAHLKDIDYQIKKAERSAFVLSILPSTATRKLFLSKESELLGLASMDAQVGDRIALLEGGKVPYILRLKDGGENEWEILGDAYVHGMMDGEAWKPEELVDIVLV